MNALRILGRGRVGKGLHRALAGPGTELLPGQTRTTGDIFILAVPDAAIADALRRLAPENPEAVFLHCAGAVSLRQLQDVLGNHAPAHLGAMHPLVSFADPDDPPELRGTCFAIAGSPKALQVARELTARCGAHALIASTDPSDSAEDRLAQDRPAQDHSAHGNHVPSDEGGNLEHGLLGARYHAAAALMANGAAALANAGVALLRDQGVAQHDAERAMAGLLRSVAENVAKVGVPAALSGPIMRGNADTVASHREALSDTAEGLAAYDAIAPIIVACAAAQGLSPEAIAAVNRALDKD